MGVPSMQAVVDCLLASTSIETSRSLMVGKLSSHFKSSPMENSLGFERYVGVRRRDTEYCMGVSSMQSNLGNGERTPRAVAGGSPGGVCNLPSWYTSLMS